MQVAGSLDVQADLGLIESVARTDRPDQVPPAKAVKLAIPRHASAVISASAIRRGSRVASIGRVDGGLRPRGWG